MSRKVSAESLVLTGEDRKTIVNAWTYYGENGQDQEQDAFGNGEMNIKATGDDETRSESSADTAATAIEIATATAMTLTPVTPKLVTLGGSASTTTITATATPTATATAVSITPVKAKLIISGPSASVSASPSGTPTSSGAATNITEFETESDGILDGTRRSRGWSARLFCCF
ncbi:uncharacterized protein DSM5745_04336 [Aspergillus mulundensis]|uniref:Uncharacterized protein n=1 Tax=Aspergillus mulundensis TaxID=1810919 RepID=A0A3D8SCE0_9EURO|nr:hypothetical protein DSM5745_04336 [Aspergillus mulundensis]RDW84010.1 hypothetical protein DSM5745_04336 [Aspergillus mulundensis]